MRTIIALLLAAFICSPAYASHHPEAFQPVLDVAAIPAYQPFASQTVTHWRHVVRRQGYHHSYETHRHPLRGPMRAPVRSIIPHTPPADVDSIEASAAGAVVGLAEGFADGIATAIKSPRACGNDGRHNLVDCRSGASTSVSDAMLPHAQCLLRWLDAVGYPVRDIGGFGERNNPSAHPTGNALDVNQLGRNVVSVRFPAGVTQAASDCGLVHGAIWSNPDTGHFEMPNKYGYVGFWHHYASHHYRHYAHHYTRRRYAGV
jgi:hypothetical protein